MPTAFACLTQCNATTIFLFLNSKFATHRAATQTLSPAVLHSHVTNLMLTLYWTVEFRTLQAPDAADLPSLSSSIGMATTQRRTSWEPYSSIKHAQAFNDYARSSTNLAQHLRTPAYLHLHRLCPTDSRTNSVTVNTRPFWERVGMLGLHQGLIQNPYHIPKPCTCTHNDVIPRSCAHYITNSYSPTTANTSASNNNDNYNKMLNIACPWVVRISVVCLHTRFRTFPPQRLAQHLLPPSPMHYICATVASSFILRHCPPVTLFV
jgi:hypothetical protein